MATGSPIGLLLILTDTVAAAPVRHTLSLLGVEAGIVGAGIPSAPTFVAAGTMVSGVGAIVPGLPAGLLANDGLLLFVENFGGDSTPSAPSGYIAIQAASTATVRIRAFAKIATGGEVAPTVADTGDHQSAVLVAFRGVDTGVGVIDGTNSGSQGAGTATTTISGVTTTGANRVIVVAIATDNTPATVSTFSSGYTNSNLSGITEMFDATHTDGNDGGLAGAYGVLAATGASGNTTATGLDESRAWVCIGLKPA